MQEEIISSALEGRDTLAILPTFDPNDANEFADIVVPTGINVLRNGETLSYDSITKAE